MRKVVAFEVWGYEACPWSVPFIGRHGGSFQTKKSRPHAGILNLPDWQKVVRDAAVAAFAKIGGQLVLAPTKTHIEFFKTTPPGHRHGELWTIGVEWNPDKKNGKGRPTGGWVKVGKSQPDILNLFKGTEDAIENVIYGNDVQTSIISSSRWYGPMPGVRVTVYAIDPGDYPGNGEPVPGGTENGKPKRRKRKPQPQ
jgi:Holliday junction resolvase RusA-like endonuclease